MQERIETDGTVLDYAVVFVFSAQDMNMISKTSDLSIADQLYCYHKAKQCLHPVFFFVINLKNICLFSV